jgi:hypothetical protein
MDVFNDDLVKKWITGDVYFTNLRNKATERTHVENWMTTYFGKNIQGNKSWTTPISEALVFRYFELRNKPNTFTLERNLTYKVGKKLLKPDLTIRHNTTDLIDIYDVKCQSYTIDGTAHEKVLCTMYKYLPILDNDTCINSLNIILVGKIEKLENYLINPQSTTQKAIIDLLKSKRANIMNFSDMVSQL